MLGGKYSSGIWTAGRLGAETAGPSAMVSRMLSTTEITTRKSDAHFLQPGVGRGTSVLGGLCTG